jgi:hypothetical protein
VTKGKSYLHVCFFGTWWRFDVSGARHTETVVFFVCVCVCVCVLRVLQISDRGENK